MKEKKRNVLLGAAMLGMGLLATAPAHARMQVDWRVQGGYYIIRVYPDLDYPVDCQVYWQVGTTSGFTRQGNTAAINLTGKGWSEFNGPMTQDVVTISPSANCQMSQRERDRRAQVEAQQRQEQERLLAIQRQREAQERARAQAAEKERQEAEKKKAQEEYARAHTLQVPDYHDAIEKNEADYRAYQERLAQEAARRKAAEQQQAQQARQAALEAQQRREQEARQQALEKQLRDMQKQAARMQQAQELARQADGMGQQLRSQAGAQDAVLSEIAGGGAARVRGMASEADAAARPQSNADIHDFLQQQLGAGR